MQLRQVYQQSFRIVITQLAHLKSVYLAQAYDTPLNILDMMVLLGLTFGVVVDIV